MKFFHNLTNFLLIWTFVIPLWLSGQQVGVFEQETGEPIPDVAIFTQTEKRESESKSEGVSE